MTAALALVVALEAAVAGMTDASAATLDAAQHHFYNGRYVEAARLSQALAEREPSLALSELRTSILHFQLRRALGEPKDRDKAFKRCVECVAFYDDFMREYRAGREAAREALRRAPDDPATLFYLGKMDLNYLWLMLGTLGHRTGWNEYWEARHSLDAALDADPHHLRARVARAWIDYIVDTRMPWGTGWMLGGGSKKKALAIMQQAAEEAAVDRPGTSADAYYAGAEALFGLWDMQVREHRDADALATARRLAALFPENAEVLRFIASRSR
jgi:tetratricopeptide (TPR) repeat protein